MQLWVEKKTQTMPGRQSGPIMSQLSKATSTKTVAAQNQCVKGIVSAEGLR